MPALEHAAIGLDAIGGERRQPRGGVGSRSTVTTQRKRGPHGFITQGPQGFSRAVSVADVEMPASAVLTGTQSAHLSRPPGIV